MDSEVTPDFMRSASTCRDEVRRCARKLKDIRLVLSGLMETPYKPLIAKATHGDALARLDWDGEYVNGNTHLGIQFASRSHTCPAIESLTRLLAGLEILIDREVAGG